MSLKKANSIFSREFKRQFNENKYSSLTRRGDDSYTHMGFFNFNELKLGRIFLYFAFTSQLFIMYLEPSYWHESIGHMTPVPKYDTISLNLSGQEKNLNEKILHRQHEEAALDHFMENMKECDQ